MIKSAASFLDRNAVNGGDTWAEFGEKWCFWFDFLGADFLGGGVLDQHAR